MTRRKVEAKMNDEDKVKREHGADGTPGKPPGPTRRQFLAGLTTGTVAIGALSQAGCGPAIPPPKTRRRHPYDDRVPFLRSGLRAGRLHPWRPVVNIEGDPGHPSARAPCAARAPRPSRW